MTSEGSLVQADGLVIGYDRALTAPLTFSVSLGQIVGLVGPNGAGKTTLLKTLTRELRPYAGDVRWRSPFPKMHVIPQESQLSRRLPIKASQVVGWGAQKPMSWLQPWRNDNQAVASAMQRTRTESLARQRYGKLSAGQRQRVLLARLVASKAELAILDEPTSALDSSSEDWAFELLQEQAQAGCGILLVSHAVGHVEAIADDIILLQSLAA